MADETKRHFRILGYFPRLQALLRNKSVYFLFNVFLFYIVFWELFGFVYFCMHYYDPTCFVFNEKILKSKSSAYKVLAERKLVELREELKSWKEYQAELNETIDKNPRQLDWPTSYFRLEPNAENSEVYSIWQKNAGEDEKLPTKIYLDTDYVNEEIADLEYKIENYEKKLKTVGTEVPEVWGISDFFYFSLVTQTTLGYGDIMPNNKYVRIVVTIQLLVSLFLVVFVVTGYALTKREVVVMEERIEFKTGGVSVATRLSDGTELTSFYPPSVPSEEIVDDSSAASQLPLESTQKKEMIEAIDYAKRDDLYVSELEIGATWEKGLTFRIKREPKRTIRYYSKK